MARTTFSGPVKSDNGFEGNITGNITGNVSATNISASGTVIFSGLPTADPEVVGQLWDDGGILTVSAGPV